MFLTAYYYCTRCSHVQSFDTVYNLGRFKSDCLVLKPWLWPVYFVLVNRPKWTLNIRPRTRNFEHVSLIISQLQPNALSDFLERCVCVLNFLLKLFLNAAETFLQMYVFSNANLWLNRESNWKINKFVSRKFDILRNFFLRFSVSLY